MTTPSKVTSPRRTRKTKSVANNVTYIDPERRNAHYKSLGKQAMIYFLHELSDEEFKLVSAYTNLIKLGRIAKQTQQECKIFPFPVGGKRGVQIAKEA